MTLHGIVPAVLSLLAPICALYACDGDDEHGGDAATGGGSDGSANGPDGTESGGRGGTGGADAAATGGTGGVHVDARAADGDAAGGAGPEGGDADAGRAALLRLVHAAPGAPAVDVYEMNGAMPIVEHLSYGDATPYFALDEGSHRFDLRPAGSSASTAPVFTTATVTVENGVHYTAIAEGDSGPLQTLADGLRVQTYEERFGPPSQTTARLRIVDANYDGPTVDLDLNDDDPGMPEVHGLAPFGESGVAGIEFPANTNVQVGVVVNGVKLTAFTTPRFAAGADVFVVATGLVTELAREPLGLSALAVLPDSTTQWIRQNPRIYALHASPDAGPVDVFAGTREVIDYARYGDFALMQVPPGAATLDFFAGRMGATARPGSLPAASVTTPLLEAGASYLAVAAGKLGTEPRTFELVTVSEGFDLTTTNAARIRAVHASANAPRLDIGKVNTPGMLATPALFQDLAFRNASAGTGASALPGTLTLGVAPAGTTSTLAEFPFTAVAGARAFAVVVGDYVGGPRPLGMFLVETTGPFWSVHPVVPR